jgi:hypothetical protein
MSSMYFIRVQVSPYLLVAQIYISKNTISHTSTNTFLSYLKKILKIFKIIT